MKGVLFENMNQRYIISAMTMMKCNTSLELNEFKGVLTNEKTFDSLISDVNKAPLEERTNNH